MAVRITSGTTNRTYLKNLNGSQHAMNKAMERVESGRDFQRVSDNVTQATRAINVRSRIYRNEQMTNNVNTAAEQLNMAESALSQMNDICSNVQSEMFKALNTPTLQAGKETFSAFLDGAKDEFMRLANTKYNDKYVLGGLGIDLAPFKANVDGKMEFNGSAIEKMVDKNQWLGISKNASNTSLDYECEYGYDADKVGFDEVLNLFNMNEKQFLDQFGSGNDDVDNWRNGIFWITDCSHKGFKGTLQDSTSVEGGDKLNPVNPAVIQNMPTSTQIQNDPENYYYEDNPVKYSGDSYVDIGLDISVAGNGKVAPKTAFKTTVDGIAAMGYGRSRVPYDEIRGLQAKVGATGTGNAHDYENVSNNIYDMMTQMQDAIGSIKDDNSNIAEVIDKISAVMVNFQKQTDKIIAAESELGVRSKFLETNLDRLEQENTSLKKMQKDIEGVDDATEITNFMSYQNAWNLVLQFGKNIVPKSLMDYVN